jgi:hypothetical protein
VKPASPGIVLLREGYDALRAPTSHALKRAQNSATIRG